MKAGRSILLPAFATLAAAAGLAATLAAAEPKPAPALPPGIVEALKGQDSTKVTELHLISPEISDQDLASLGSMTQLRELHISWAKKVTDAGLRHLKSLRKLQKLTLIYTQVSDGGLEHLKMLTQLHVLYIGRNQMITDAGLAHLKSLTELQELDLARTKISDAGLKHLVSYTSLKVLNLCGTLVSSAGVEMLKKHLPECDILWFPR